LALPIDGNQAALHHLRGYIGLLLAPDGMADGPPLNVHIGATLADLMAIVLGASGDAAQLARVRDLCAAICPPSITPFDAPMVHRHPMCAPRYGARTGNDNHERRISAALGPLVTYTFRQRPHAGIGGPARQVLTVPRAA
jgi:hypothetical protein